MIFFGARSENQRRLVARLHRTADRKIQVTIATAALTAGKMAICIDWVGPFDNVVPR